MIGLIGEWMAIEWISGRLVGLVDGWLLSGLVGDWLDWWMD